MTKVEVLENLRKQIHEENRDPQRKLKNIPGYAIEYIERFGGEDEASYCYVILKITNISDGSYFFTKSTGYYNSYDGFEWTYGNTLEVSPVQKTITVYE